MKALTGKAAEALQRSKDAALARVRRVKERDQEMKAGAIGIGAGYISAGFVGKRRAEAQRGTRETAGFKLGTYDLDLTKVGGGMAIAGAMGLLGDDMYDDIAYASGVAVLAADQAIDAYEAKMAEPPSE